MSEKYATRVHDIVVQTPSLPSQRLYRVEAIELGATEEESYVQLKPIGMAGDNASVPVLLLERSVDAGVIQCVWREEDMQ